MIASVNENSFAGRLKAILKRKGITLQQVADAIGKSQPAVFKWTKGGEIEYENLRALAKYLDVNWIWLRYGEEALRELPLQSEQGSPMEEIRRKYLNDILESEARMKLAQEVSGIVTWEWNVLTDAINYSINTEKMFGRHLYEMADFWAVLLPEDKEGLVAAINRSLATGNPYEWDFRIRLNDGRLRWISSRATLVLDPDKRPVKMIGVSIDITARKQAEEALRESEARYRSIFEQAAEGIAYIDVTGKWLKVNPRLRAILGYSDAELLGLTMQDLTHPEDLEHNIDQLHRLLAGEIEAYTLEKRLIRKDGQAVWVNVTTTAGRDLQTGRPMHLIAIIEDITERKRVQSDLESSRERLKLALESADLGEWEMDLDTGEVISSEKVNRMFGFDSGHSHKHFDQFLERIDPNDRPMVVDAIQRLSREQGRYRVTYRVMLPDGQVRWIQEAAIALQDDQGKWKKLIGIDQVINDNDGIHCHVSPVIAADKMTRRPIK